MMPSINGRNGWCVKISNLARVAPQRVEWLSPYARIVHWYNSGAAFGMFQNGNLVFTTLAIIVVIAILLTVRKWKRRTGHEALAMGLACGCVLEI
jgi:signal peptidase II